MNKAYRERIKHSKEQQDILIKDSVKRYGHHGLDVVVQTIRQKHNIAADPDYVRVLIQNETKLLK